MHITVPMFEKGRSFVMASGLVKAYEAHRFVYLHLMCQGLECIGKAALLAHDYDKYEPVLRTQFGHDLEVLVAEMDQNAGSAFLSAEASMELKSLNAFYKKHLLRYGNAADFTRESSELVADHLHRDLLSALTELNNTFAAYGGDF